jgi:hypothetical protein
MKFIERFRKIIFKPTNADERIKYSGEKDNIKSHKIDRTNDHLNQSIESKKEERMKTHK